MENEGKKCTDDEEDEAGMRKKITAKKDEVGKLVKFVKQACAEATQSEDEVAQTIGIITQIEVVNRLYDVYIKSVQALGAQERLWDQQRAVYEAERARVVEAYKDKVGQLIMGIVKRVEHNGILIDLGNNTEAFIEKEHLIPREVMRNGERVRAYLKEVRSETKGPQLFLSRTDPNFLIQLFCLEVPEVGQDLIEILGAARDPGIRAKISVKSNL